jgi:transketolase
MISQEELQQLQLTAWQLRYKGMEMIIKAGSGHPGPILSVADIITTLYFRELRIDPQNPEWPERDRMILSKGHACPILYAALARKGYFPEELLWSLRQPGSKLQGHPDMKKLPGIDMTTGSLGNGLSAGVGMALAGKLDQKDYRVFVVLGDGELQEGLNWEAAMSASHYKLDNLVGIVDYNGLQSSGKLEDVMGYTPMGAKWEAFGWHVVEVDGHDIKQISAAVHEAKTIKEKPTMIIAHTTKGKGVSFMENDYMWHSQTVKGEQAAQALAELAEGVKRYE